MLSHKGVMLHELKGLRTCQGHAGRNLVTDPSSTMHDEGEGLAGHPRVPAGRRMAAVRRPASRPSRSGRVRPTGTPRPGPVGSGAIGRPGRGGQSCHHFLPPGHRGR